MFIKLLLRIIFFSFLCVSFQYTIADDGHAQLRAESQRLTESQVLSQYEGITGTAPPRSNVSSAGGAFEFLPNGSNFYAFFSQTLSNDIYYEVRLYGRYNYQSGNPTVPELPPSTASVPMGYGVSGFLGYNFHPSSQVDITPYARLNAYHDMGPVFDDNQGDYLTSNTYALLLGGKLVFRATSTFAPYVNIWGGYQNNDLTGAYPNASATGSQASTGVLNQFAMTYEIGMAARVAKNMFLIPYMGYITTLNYPDATAQAAIDHGGLNQNNLAGTAQYFGLKFSVAW